MSFNKYTPGGQTDNMNVYNNPDVKDPMPDTSPRQNLAERTVVRGQMSNLVEECQVTKQSETYLIKSQPVIKVDQNGNPTEVGEDQILQVTTHIEIQCEMNTQLEQPKSLQYTIKEGQTMYGVANDIKLRVTFLKDTPTREITEKIAKLNGYQISIDQNGNQIVTPTLLPGKVLTVPANMELFEVA